MSQVTLVPLLAWVAALAFWGIAVWRGPRPIPSWFVIDRALRYIFIFPLGMLGVWAFVGHVLFSVETAQAIGWPPSPFQFEVGYASLGIGLASLYAAFTTFYARVSVAVCATCFLVGAGIGHVHDIIAYGNLTAGNAAPIMVTGFLTPVVTLALLIASARRPSVGKLTIERASDMPRSPDSRELEAEIEVARDAMRNYREALDRFVKS